MVEEKSGVPEDAKVVKKVIIIEEPKSKRIPFLCRIGFHKYYSKTYHEEKGSFVEHSVKVCKRCGKKVKGTRKFDWDKSK